MNASRNAACLLVALLVVLWTAPPAIAEEMEPGDIMEGLERGIHALRALGRHDEAERLLRIAQEVREKRAHAEQEQAAARRMMEMCRLAMPALREGEKTGEAGALERTIHALELGLARHPAEKVRAAWKEAPKGEGLIEILRLAARMWRESDRPEKAETLEGYSNEILEKHHAGREDGREREMAKHRIKVLRYAMLAMQEAERPDAAERLEHAVHAVELGLAGRRDEEARRIREAAPRAEETAELLRDAAKLWTKFGHEQKAELCAALAGEISEARERRPSPQPDPRDAVHDERIERIDHMQRRMEQLTRQIEELRQELERMRRER